MPTLAIYNTKGGVGKTSMAVNLAWAAAREAGLRTLLWDLDPQAASTFILAHDRAPKASARAVFERGSDPMLAVVDTDIADLDLVPADSSLRSIDILFAADKGQRKLRDLLAALANAYDLVVLDCPPGLSATGEQILRGASLILVPMLPSTLSARACDEVCEYVGGNLDDGPPIFPVFTMVDRRRTAHREALAADPAFPVIPMASAVELMADRHAPVGAFAPRSTAALAYVELWRLVAPHLTAGKPA